MARDGAKVLSQ